MKRIFFTTAVLGLLLLLSACGSSTSSQTAEEVIGPVVVNGQLKRFDAPTTIKVVTHSSFAVSQSVLDEFEAQTNVKVELVQQGDAVAMTNAAILTAGNPVGDVLFGIDENLLGSVTDANLLIPFTPQGISGVSPEFILGPKGLVTPIDHGDVCVNFDRNGLGKSGAAIPATFNDLLDPQLKNDFVVQDPTASTPGLAFMLATIAWFGGGDDVTANAPWLQYWKQLKSNGVKIADGWESAYYGDFSGGSGKGDRPLVVSYASSPPAEITDTSLAVDETPTGVVTSTCYRQTEFAGVLAGSNHPEEAAAFIEFMLSPVFQEDMPGQMYVFPVVEGTPLPEIFAKYTVPVAQPLSLPYEEVSANRDRWVKQWSALFR